jgi:hypothetical protein
MEYNRDRREIGAFLSILDLAGVALPTGEREGLFVMLRAYFDDSGTHDDSEVVVVGGLVGSVEQWTAFEQAWAARLADPLPGYNKPPLRMFHLSHCNAKDGEFSGYTDGECDAVTHDFRQIIIDFRLVSTASAIDKRAWDELVVGENRQWLGDAADACVDNCMQEAMKIAGPPPDGDLVAVVFDRGMQTVRRQAVAEEYTFSLGRPRVISVTFSSVRDVLPLQGADIVATENYWHAIQILRNGLGAQPRAHMRHYLTHMFAEGFMIDRDRIVEMLPSMEAHIQTLKAT